jgi:hypothetical protein
MIVIIIPTPWSTLVAAIIMTTRTAILISSINVLPENCHLLHLCRRKYPPRTVIQPLGFTPFIADLVAIAMTVPLGQAVNISKNKAEITSKSTKVGAFLAEGERLTPRMTFTINTKVMFLNAILFSRHMVENLRHHRLNRTGMAAIATTKEALVVCMWELQNRKDHC